MEPNTEPNKTQTIARNSFWYGSETLVGFVLLFATSIPLARILGPEKLGYFNYVAWLTAMTTSLGALGIPGVAAKYIAEHIGRGERGVVRAVFFRCFKLQILLATCITAVALGIVLFWGDPHYTFVSSMQVLSIFPAMVGAVPSMTNYAQERMAANFAGSMVSAGVYLLGVVLSLWLGWGLAGVAVSLLIGRLCELIIRVIPCVERMKTFPAGGISPALGRQMVSFARKQVILLILGLIVWDRSDLVLLKLLSSDIKQITFFSIVYNLTEKLLLVPRVFGGAVSASLLVQYGRDSDKMRDLAVAGTRYMVLIGAPLLAGVALVSPSLIRVMYGAQYTPAIPVLTIAALFAIIKSILDPANNMLLANDRQGPAVVCSLFCAALNIGLDWLLIPAHGAVGAAIGNGVAQATLVIAYWVLCMVLFRVAPDFRSAGKVAAGSAAMAIPVLLLNHLLPPLPALIAGSISGAVIYVAVLAITSFFRREDYARLGHLGDILPGAAQPAFRAALNFLIPADSTAR